MLRSTGNAMLEEGNTWNDTFWGFNNKTGKGPKQSWQDSDASTGKVTLGACEKYGD